MMVDVYVVDGAKQLVINKLYQFELINLSVQVTASFVHSFCNIILLYTLI